MIWYHIKNYICLPVVMFLLICCNNDSFAQLFNEEWVNKWSQPLHTGSDKAFDLTIDKNGNVYVTGSTNHPAEQLNYITIKYSPDGEEQWAVQYNGIDNNTDVASAITTDDEGNVYVTGRSNIFENGLMQSDYLTIKYNPGGEEEWISRYSGPVNSDGASDIAVDKQGNVYVTGSSIGVDTDSDILTVKYNSEGIEQWAARYAPLEHGNDESRCVEVDINGNVYVSGLSKQDSVSGWDLAIIKYNTDGDQQWVSVYSTNGNDEPYDMVLDDSGNVYVTGESSVFATGRDYITIKYNTNGEEQWASRFTGLNTTQSERAHAIAVDKQNNVYVTGQSYGGTAGGLLDIATVKYNSIGSEEWVARYNYVDAGLDTGEDIVVDDEGNVYVGGNSLNENNNYDYVLLKYNTDGVEQWAARYNGTADQDDDLEAIGIDSKNNIYITGGARETGTSEDVVTIKYSQTSTNVNEEEKSISDFKLLQNYPNPFNPATCIEYRVVSSEYVTLKIYDVLGNEIEVLVNEEKPAGIYEVNFDASGLTSGIYYYRFQAGSFSETKKMMLIK